MRTLKILGYFLTYPSENHRLVVDECRSFLKNENWLSVKTIDRLETLFKSFEKRDLLDLQEDYVDLFDRTPSLSLHLFEHVHGDSRDRGQAMVDLGNVYQAAGLLIKEDEMPDYLPLFLEYVSTLPPEDVKENLNSVVNILSALAERLKNRSSDYAAVFDSIVEAASRKPDPKEVETALSKDSGAAYDLKKVDAEWEEQFAFENTPQTTGQDSACPKADEMLSRMAGYNKAEGVEK